MKKEIAGQYKAALQMLIDVAGKCPDSQWNDTDDEVAFWRIVYHSLYYTSLYLSDSPAAFTPWEKHIANYNSLGTHTHDNKPVVISQVYPKADLLAYAEILLNNCENEVDRTVLEEGTGFDWLPISRLGLHIYNIRHIQHHTGQLIERLHRLGLKGFRWQRGG